MAQGVLQRVRKSTIMIPKIENPTDSKVKPIFQKPTCDTPINAKKLQSKRILEKRNFVRRSIALEGDNVGSCDKNTKLDSIACEFKFSNSLAEECSARIMSESKLNTLNHKGSCL